MNNVARKNTNTSLPLPLLAYGHGGAMFVRFVSSSVGTVCLKDSVFSNNTSEASGGAVQLSMSQYSNNNSVWIEGTQFRNNTCSLNSSTGGGVALFHYQQSHHNVIKFVISKFSDNMATAGGAVSLLTSVGTGHEEMRKQAMIFYECQFEHNMARDDGTAVSLFSVTPINKLNFPVEVTNW